MTLDNHNANNLDTEGVIFNLMRFCVNDGPGIRTTVFFKGCPLHCRWCHNPEGISPHMQLSLDADTCILCRKCADACARACHMVTNIAHRVQQDACDTCGRCIDACGRNALKQIGGKISVRDTMKTILKDAPYYRASSGGATLSGGEVLYQTEFACSLLSECKEHDIHTCVETSGIGDPGDLQRIGRLAVLVLYDFKHSDAQALHQYTGADLAEVYRGLELLSRMHKPVVLRCPLIHGVNDTQAHLVEIARLANAMRNIMQIDLLPYHNLGLKKARDLFMDTTEFSAPGREELSSFIRFLQTETKLNIRCE